MNNKKENVLTSGPVPCQTGGLIYVFRSHRLKKQKGFIGFKVLILIALLILILLMVLL